ncbi:MAG: response regulator transcription factor [Alkalispirochaeta sp.]
MTGTVLIVEDEQELAELIHVYLENNGLQAVPAYTAEEALAAMDETRFDLIVLDINLPGMDGFEFLQTIRRSHNLPVIIVSAREADEDIVMGLGIGADEFVTKPFSPRVLVARVRSLLRRQRMSSTPEREVIRFGNFELDTAGYNLRENGELVRISTREFELLRFLVRNAGVVFSTDELYRSVWEQEYGDTTAIPVYIQRLRKKIERDYRRPEIIITVHGKGYRFSREALR